MTVLHESTPYEGDPDDFDLLVGELLEHMEDPYLTDVHRTARQLEKIIAEPGGDNPYNRRMMVNVLDEKWRYMRQMVEVTGKAWVARPDEPGLVPHMCIGETVKSYGFIFFSDDPDKDGDQLPKIGHCIEITDTENDAKYPAVVTLDDLDQLELPAPSPEARERRFAYYNEEQANWIDEMAFTSERDDQVIPSFREFYYDVNLYAKDDNERIREDSDDIEHLHDAMEYMRRRAEIEPKANYKISVFGDVLVVDGEGNGIPTHLNKPYTKTMKINDIVLRPADITIAKLEGLQRCVPFIDATAFRDNGTDVDLLIPCTSILWMHSLRYDGPPKH